MRRLRTRARDLAFLAGINLYQLACLRHAPRFIRDLAAYRRQNAGGRFPFRASRMLPILVDFHSQAGVARGAYFHQDLWAARRIHGARPAAHVDIGSRIDGFVAHLLTFMPVTVVDVRPLESRVAGLSFARGDLTNLASLATASVASLSCLHTVEHVGLGRYGDAIDADGWSKALAELARVLQPGGHLYVSVPIGVEGVHFNAHRVFAPRTITSALPSLRLVHFSAVDEAGDLCPDADLDAFATAADSCGLFEFVKP